MENKTIQTNRKEKIISWLLVLFGTLVYLSLVFNENVWLDEAFTASLVRTDMAGVLERSMADTLPPLYNILLKISTDIFGYTVPVMKVTSVVPMIITMILSATVVRKHHGFKVSTLFTIALFSMPNLLFYGVEIRMYSLGFLFATASGIFAYEFICNYNKKNLIIFTVVSVLAGYSHHFAFVTVGMVYLFILLYYFFLDRKNIKRWFTCLLLTFVLYLPCLIVTLQQFKSVSGYFSMPEVTASVFAKYARYPYTTGNTVISIVLMVCVFMLLAYTLYRIIFQLKNKADIADSAGSSVNNESVSATGEITKNYCNRTVFSDMYAVSMFIAYYMVLVFGTLISKVMTANIFVDRYLLFAHGLIWLFFAVEAGKFKKYYYAFVIVLVASGIVGYINEYHIEYDTNPNEIKTFLETEVSDGDVLYTVEKGEEMAYCLTFYDEGLTNYEDLKEAVDVANNTNADIWIAILKEDGADEYDFSEISEYGLKTEFAGTYTFDRYTVDMYKVY